MNGFESYLARERYEQDCRDSAAIQRCKKRNRIREERRLKSTETMVRLTAVCFALIIAFGVLATVLDL